MAYRADFEDIVERHYAALYRFALSLSGKENDARDLVQQTFYLWAVKGHHLRDISKIKSWLFTTLYREFLQLHRRATRFPHHELDEMTEELPQLIPEAVSGVDTASVLSALDELPATFKGPVALFYLEDCSYKEIAELLDIPLGTVKSRIARGVAQLQTFFVRQARAAAANQRGRNE
jgi:RNA polymerase sigma-70 factor (ECF subfamily)